MGSIGVNREEDFLLVDSEGHRESLLGNEAIVRGALEAGVTFASGYPGTPSSEITDSFARIASSCGIAFEYSVNEKIALEMAFAASLAGARAICAMKHLGLMYAGDPLSTIPYVGVVGGLVIVSAGDPSCRTSPNEQDQRRLGPMLHIPVLDPSTPQEALDLTRFAFDLSEACELPVLLRPTTRVCHSRSMVRYGRLEDSPVAGFERHPGRFNPIPANARRLRVEVQERIRKACAMIADAALLRREGSGANAILASGVPAATTSDILEEHGVGDELCRISLGAVYPLPEEQIVTALEGVRRLLVIEELSPFIEDAVAAISARRHLDIEILGKRSGHLPEEFEYEPQIIRKGLHQAFGIGEPPVARGAEPQAPPRPPVLCPGCPHRTTYFAARSAFGDDQLFFNDIGCYTLGFGPPLNTSDALLCMGAGFTLAAGVARVTGERTVGFMGDSTFFHSGMPALLDAVKENADIVAVILDNEVTAMTGFQESPTVEVEETEPKRAVSIEGVVRALGVEHVERIDPVVLPHAVAAFDRARKHRGVAVVISEHACPVYLDRLGGVQGKRVVFEIDHSRCSFCGREALGTRCSTCGNEAFSRQLARSRVQAQGWDRDERPTVAACATACPLNLCVQGYSTRIAAGEYSLALELIMERLPLPDSVCRVCHRPCESRCIRSHVDSPVAINDLKRFVMDWAAAQDEFPYEPPREETHGHSVAVVGAGPSGLAAAHELAIRGYEVTVYDANAEPGGLLRYGISSYRLPREALDRDIARIRELGVTFVANTRLGRDIELGDLGAEQCDAVYLAIGAHRSVGAPFECEADAPTMLAALDFLRDDHGPDARVKGRVLVVGGGSTAFDVAGVALRRGAATVTIAALEARAEMPVTKEEVEWAEQDGVEIRNRCQVTRARPGGVDTTAVTHPEGAEFDFARVRPVAGSASSIDTDLIVLAIGQEPDPGAFAGGDISLAQDGDGRIRVDPETGATSDPRIFAGGDLVPGERYVTSAIAAGLRAAWAIDRHVRGAAAADRRTPPPIPEPDCPVVRLRPDSTEPKTRELPPMVGPSQRSSSWVEVTGCFDDDQARREASRCMVCGLCGNCRACIDTFGCPAFVIDGGRIEIDPMLCTGCGVCPEFCPNGAIVEATDA